VIAGFSYDDAEPWPVDADGAGYALVLNHVAAFPAYGVAESWRSSAVIGGTPGLGNGALFAGVPTADADGDGMSDLLEYAVGSNPADGSAARLPVLGSELFTVNAVTNRYLTFAFYRNLGADGITFEVQSSPDLAEWTDGGTEMIYVSTQNHGDGTATVTYRSSTPIGASAPNHFLRLKVSAK
jgi:hypothetical protein